MGDNFRSAKNKTAETRSMASVAAKTLEGSAYHDLVRGQGEGFHRAFWIWFPETQNRHSKKGGQIHRRQIGARFGSNHGEETAKIKNGPGKFEIANGPVDV